MDTRFSETQFSFAVTRELANGKVFPGKTGVPCFPSARSERVVGYDVMLDKGFYTLYLQYKIPQYIRKSNSNFWNDFSGPYFYIKPWKANISNQHNILVDLANANRKNQVFYCAPAFWTETEFNDYYNRNLICHNSIFINCRDLPHIYNDDQHHITYNINPDIAFMRSKSVQVEAQKGLSYIDNVIPYENIDEFREMIVKTMGDVARIRELANNLTLEEIGEVMFSYGICLFAFEVD